MNPCSSVPNAILTVSDTGAANVFETANARTFVDSPYCGKPLTVHSAANVTELTNEIATASNFFITYSKN